MSMRDEFEAWAIESGETALSKAHMLKSEDGEYYNYAAKTYWKAWQASRAALVVELPTQERYDDPLSAYEAIKDCRKAIKATGVQVKT